MTNHIFDDDQSYITNHIYSTNHICYNPCVHPVPGDRHAQKERKREKG